MLLTASGLKLAEAIKKAIEDHVITTNEYQEIMAVVDEDHHVDAHERKLLAELNSMIANKAVRRIPG